MKNFIINQLTNKPFGGIVGTIILLTVSVLIIIFK
jgi:hypothetical protein